MEVQLITSKFIYGEIRHTMIGLPVGEVTPGFLLPVLKAGAARNSKYQKKMILTTDACI